MNRTEFVRMPSTSQTSLATNHSVSANCIARTAKVGGRFFVAKTRKKKLIAMGSALAAELLVGVRQAGVPLRLNTGLTDLITEKYSKHYQRKIREA